MKEKAFSSGAIQTVDTEKSTYKGFWPLRDIFKEFLKKLNVKFYDKCCPTSDTSMPTGFDTETQTITYYNYETDTWDAVPNSSISTITIGDTPSIDLEGLGTEESPLTATVIIDPAVDNALEITGFGLYVAPSEGIVPFLAEHQIAFGDVNDAITSSSELTFNTTTKIFDVNFTSGNNSRLVLDDTNQIMGLWVGIYPTMYADSTTTVLRTGGSYTINADLVQTEVYAGPDVMIHGNPTETAIFGQTIRAITLVSDRTTIHTNEFRLENITGAATAGTVLTNIGGGVGEWQVPSGGGGADTTTASNGLTEVGNDVKLGGTLTENTTITASTFSTSINGNGTQQLFNLWNAGSGHAFVSASNGGVGVTANSGTSTALVANSTSGSAIQASGGSQSGIIVSNSADTSISNILTLTHQSNTGNPGVGLGARLVFSLDRPLGVGAIAATVLESVWDNITAGSTISRFKVGGILNDVPTTLLEISGAGIFTLTQGLPDYADDAAAAAGTPSIPINSLYRTGSIVKIRVS